MPLVEPVDPTWLKQHPYWNTWLNELGRSAEEVLDFNVQSNLKEVPSDTQYKKFEPTGDFIACIVFKNGDHVSRTGKWSDGKMIYIPEEES